MDATMLNEAVYKQTFIGITPGAIINLFMYHLKAWFTGTAQNAIELRQ